SRIRDADGRRRRLQARGRDPRGQAGARLAHPYEGRARRSLAQAGVVPARGKLLADGYRASARAFRDRPLRRRPPSSDGVMATVAKLFETMEYGPAPESDAPALEWLKHHDNGRFGHFSNGRWVAPVEDQYFETINPATKVVLARVAQGSKADVDAAVAAANAAAPGWAGLSAHARARFLYALAREVQRHSRLLAVLESLDNGKP